MKLLSVVGARPQFVKLGPIARSLARHAGVTHTIVHTGQHYDEKMSTVFFDQLELPKPGINLEVGSGSHAVQSADMLTRLEAAFLKESPDVVIVYGDTNSTLAAALCATKMHIPVVHIEAGLRSFNRAMPEEINRIVADHTSDRLYAPTETAMTHLQREGLGDKAVQTGDVMRDAVIFHSAQATASSTVLETQNLTPGEFAVCTIHRPANTDTDALVTIASTLSRLADQQLPIVFPLHPRVRPAVMKLPGLSDKLQLIDPVPYLDMLKLVAEARLVATDSGGLQKEAAFLETPCITLREDTEWVETLELGVNRLVGSDPVQITNAFEHAVGSDSPFNADVLSKLNNHYGTGHSADIIVDDLLSWLALPDQNISANRNKHA
ncbi:MAG: UDP-N-acetylglucosamine 2-epimerase (non-hydrolyzing) [Gammaproteobacteria bacterium]|nr:UDP-N-acetylglucosamine 2-epimerase (non-hydrolyzing) [Gammaproteobacteria bacterium]